MSTEESKVVVDLLHTDRHDSEIDSNQASQMMDVLGKDNHDSKVQDTLENAENEAQVSKTVKSQMLGILDTVRSGSHWLEEKKNGATFLGSSQEAKIPSPRIGVESYLREKTLRDIEVKGYVKRLKDGFPDRKFEINYDNKNYIKMFAPYAPLHRKPSGDDTSRKEMWKVPYDNRYYTQALIYGESSRDSFYPGDRGATDNYRFYDVERNVYDYAHGKYKVSLGKPPGDEEKKTFDNYRFWDVERNIHDFENQTSEVSSGGRKPSEDKEKKTFDHYRFWDVERNIQDSEDQTPEVSSGGRKPSEGEEKKTFDNYRFRDVERNIHDSEDQTPVVSSGGGRKPSERKDNDYYYSYIETSSPDKKGKSLSPVNRLSIPEIQEQHKDHKNDFGVSHNEDFAKYLERNGVEMTINTRERWTKKHHGNDHQEENRTANKMEPNTFRSLVINRSDDTNDKSVPQIR